MCNGITCTCDDCKAQIKCWKCHGEKKIYIGSTELTCPICKGIGYPYLVDKET